MGAFFGKVEYFEQKIGKYLEKKELNIQKWNTFLLLLQCSKQKYVIISHAMRELKKSVWKILLMFAIK